MRPIGALHVMNATFRVDASNSIGVGHLMRCLTLAKALRRRGARVRFVCRDHVGNQIDVLRRAALPVSLLPRAPEARAPEARAPEARRSEAEDYAAWLGVSMALDAEQTIRALDKEHTDWLIVDHYGLDQEWELLLRPHVAHVMVIEDLYRRTHDCDLLLNQNFFEGDAFSYERQVPDNCRVIMGPRFALLRPEYRAQRQATAPRDGTARDGTVRRALVYFGGSDPHNITGMVLEAFGAPTLLSIQLDVVVGVNSPHRVALEAAAAARPGTTIHGPRPHLADLMANADLALGAGGGTTWERLCVGIPSLVVSVAENQVPACKALSKAGVIVYAGASSHIDVDSLRQILEQWVDKIDGLVALSRQGTLMVDGLGALRVSELLDPTSVDALKMRPAQATDCGLYFRWVNDPQVRAQAIASGPVKWVDHKTWFRNKLTNDSSHLFVLEAGDLPVGQIRFDRNESGVTIDYSLDEIVRGRGWGTRLVELGMHQLPFRKQTTFLAEVKVGNRASRRVFARLGFEQSSEPGSDAGEPLAFYRYRY